MITRTLFFTNPGALTIRNGQLSYTAKGEEAGRIIPLDDVGFVVVENPHFTITAYCLAALAEHNVAVIFCNNKMIPCAQLNPIASHTTAQKHIEA